MDKNISVVRKQVMVDRYVFDGKEYDTEEQALNAKKDSARLVELLATANALPYCTLDTVGFYKIENEGAVDYSDTRGRQTLAIVFGTLRQACEYAVGLKGFWGYGPGRITAVNFVNLMPDEKKNSLIEWARS